LGESSPLESIRALNDRHAPTLLLEAVLGDPGKQEARFSLTVFPFREDMEFEEGQPVFTLPTSNDIHLLNALLEISRRELALAPSTPFDDLTIETDEGDLQRLIAAQSGQIFLLRDIYDSIKRSRTQISMELGPGGGIFESSAIMSYTALISDQAVHHLCLRINPLLILVMARARTISCKAGR